MNTVNLGGRMASDIKIVNFQKGGKERKVGNFRFAVNGKGAYKDRVNFFLCTAFDAMAELILKYSGKGLKAYITGHLDTSSYTKDGSTIYNTYVVVDDIDFEDYKDAKGNTSENSNEQNAEDGFEDISAEELAAMFSR